MENNSGISKSKPVYTYPTCGEGARVSEPGESESTARSSVAVHLVGKNGFLEYVLYDAMHGITGVTARAMFGAFGLYKEGVVFGIVDDDQLYLKVDQTNLSEYKACQSQPLTYEGKNKKEIVLPYWEVPVDVLEDREKLAEWVEASVHVSQRAKKSK